MERDLILYTDFLLQLFQLTRPAWSVTPILFLVLTHRQISTHTPRVERDEFEPGSIIIFDDFNSHAPRGA